MLQESVNEILEEGLWDRFKAHGASAMGAVKGAGQQLKGVAKQAAGSAVSRVGNLAQKGVEAVGGTVDPSKNKLLQKGSEMQQSGSEDVQTGSLQAGNAKIDSYKNSVGGKIDGLIAEIGKDMQKLGIQVNNVKFQQFAKSMKSSLLNSLDALKR